MKAKSLIALLLLLACILCSFAACQDTGNTSSAVSGNDQSQTTSQDVSTEPEEVFPFEDYYEEQTLKILCVSTSRHVYGTLQFVPDPESNYTAVSEAVKARNDMIEEKYGLTIETHDVQYPVTELRTLVESGLCDYDLVCESVDRMMQSVTENLFWSVDDLVDYSYSWWDKNAIDALSIAGKHYFLSGDALITDDDNTYLYLFNKDMYNDNTVFDSTYGDIYQMVKDGKFTIDVFEEMCRVVSQPSPDGQWDFYATYGNLSHAYGATVMMNGFDFATASPDDNGYFTLNVGSEYGVNLFDKVYSLMSDKQVTQRAELIIGQGANPSKYGFAELEEMFVSGRGLFYNTTSSSISILKARGDEVAFEFGVLPIPKYDEAQPNYCNTVNRYQSSVIGIPVSNTENREATCVLLQALGYHSKEVTNAYYQQTLQLQALTDNNDADMLDLIYSNRFFDIGAMFEWGNSALINFYGALINNTASNEVVSRWDAIEDSVTKGMQETIDAYNSSLT